MRRVGIAQWRVLSLLELAYPGSVPVGRVRMVLRPHYTHADGHRAILRLMDAGLVEVTMGRLDHGQDEGTTVRITEQGREARGDIRVRKHLQMYA